MGDGDVHDHECRSTSGYSEGKSGLDAGTSGFGEGSKRVRVRIKVRVMACKCFFSKEKISMAPAQG